MMQNAASLRQDQVPAECYVSKPHFYTRPSPQVIREIKAWIKDGNMPHMYKFHTHSKPLATSIPEYLDEFTLHAKYIKARRWAPCPICTHGSPKFGYAGKIAWFPSEGVIRLIGPKCFARLNKGAHEAALSEMKKRKKRESDNNYLIGEFDRLAEGAGIIEAALVVAKALDELGDDLRDAIYERSALSLGSYILKGELRVWKERTFIDKEGFGRKKQELDVYARLRGHGLLDPDLKPLAPKLIQCKSAFGYLTSFKNKQLWDDHIISLAGC